MKRLHRMIIRAYLGPLMVTFVIVLFILVMQFLWKWVDDLMGKGLDGTCWSNCSPTPPAGFVPLALPLAVLLIQHHDHGRAGRTFGADAHAFSADWDCSRIMAPWSYFRGGSQRFSFFFSNNLLPVANLKFQSLLWDVTREEAGAQPEDRASSSTASTASASACGDKDDRHRRRSRMC